MTDSRYNGTPDEKRQYQRDAYRRKVEAEGGWRTHKIKQRYGITINDYENMYRQQNGLCKICGSPPYQGKPLHIDHDHKTGKVRALLCFKCNNMLGLANDNPALLREAALYLDQFRESP